MGRIQADTGLMSGVPITDTVDKLMALNAAPRDLLTATNTDLKAEQTAVTELTALLASVQYLSKNLGKSDLYVQRSAYSSNTSALTATVSGNPPLGSYLFTPLRTAQSQQWLSSSLKSDTAPLGSGKVTFRYGDTLDRGVQLGSLNAGQGIDRGKIRITDGSGASAEIDLTAAQTIDDVLSAINEASGISVSAVAEDGHIQLIDTSGQTAAHLKVQEVAGGTTAASLGLAGIDTAAAVADGQNIFQLGDNLDLDVLNDGAGIRRSSVLPDIQYTLSDGTSGEIDLSPILSGGSTVDRETTLGQMLTRLNAAAPGKLKFSVAADGQRLVATDLTGGGGSFSLTSLNDSAALADLGLTGTASGATITGQRILGGMKTVLLSSLKGGQGLGDLGQLQLTDRSGATATVDLAGAETVEQVAQRINAAGLGIEAGVNLAGNGLQLVDTSATHVSNLIVANGSDGTNTADKLGLAVNSDVSGVNSGDLHLRVMARNTQLSTLNGGAGITRGTFTITDSTGARATIDLTSTSIQTVGDVVDAINRMSTNVHADLNSTGDGILLEDHGGGSQTLTVAEGTSTTAKSLHLLNAVTTVDRQGVPTQVMDGTTTESIEISATDSLQDLTKKINDSNVGMAASVFSDGSTVPYRLTLTASRSGRAGQMVLDTSQSRLALRETAEGQDALLGFGGSNSSGQNVLISSATNQFQNVVSGVSLEIKQASASPVTVTVQQNDTNLVASVKTMVDNYNKFRTRLKELTAYNTDTSSRAVLTGDATALRLDTDLSNLLSSRLRGSGSIQSLAQVGVTISTDGSLTFDDTKLSSQFAADPTSVQNFFATKDTGWASRLDTLLEQISGSDKNSLLSSRLKTLQDKISDNQTRIDAMTARLATQREALLNTFYYMDAAIGKLKNSLTVINSIQYIGPYTGTSSSGSSS